MGRVLCAAALFAAATAAAPDKPPRYRLEVGQELRYETSYRLDYKALLLIKCTIRRTFDRRIWVVRHNRDGSFRLFVGTKKTDDGGETSHWFSYCDLFPDGRFARNLTLNIDFDPAEIFKPLPRGAAATRWEGHNVLEEILRCETLPGDKGWRFRETLDSARDRVAGRTRTTTVTFDVERGLASRIETKVAYKNKNDGVGAFSTRLVSVTRREPAWIAQLARESDLWFETMTVLGRLCEERDEATVRAGYARARVITRELRKKITLPLLRKRLDECNDFLDTAEREAITAARRSARWVGKPAPDWELEGLDGNRHALKDYRGRVVLLDFWHDECGPCLCAMPALKRVAHHYRGRPVAVLGMSVDRDPAEARRVAEAFKLNYVTLHARKIRYEYGVFAFPTMVVIDPEGLVRRVLVGHAPSREEEIKRIIDGLLSSAPLQKEAK